MWMLKNKATGEIVDPRSADFPLSPSDFGHNTWEDVFAEPRETDLIDGYEVVASE